MLWAAFFLCFVCFGISRWVLWPVKVSGDSMVPSYEDGQPNYINKLAYLSHNPERGDVVGVQVDDGDFYLKRVVGLPGEKVEFYRGTVLVDGRPLVEPYIKYPLLWALPPVQLGPNQYFIMGDNRRLSMLGAVDKRAIVGKVLF
ncbi:MAG TPA: signal peptidase I [Candidatus Limnocylindria bacterium]|nr:signal peptidase I [Candidatus Limnocylindria bacterium]